MALEIYLFLWRKVIFQKYLSGLKSSRKADNDFFAFSTFVIIYVFLFVFWLWNQ